MGEHAPTQVLAGKVALVTGGTRGLGREMVEAFADAGADVVISSRKMDSCVEAADAVHKRTGRRCVPYACHVGRWDEIPGLIEAAYENFGRLDIVVNNAGISPLYPSLDALSEELFDKTIGVNLKGPFYCVRAARPFMEEAGDGVVVNISSIAGIRAVGSSSLAYGAAKAGIINMTMFLARALAPAIRVNCVTAGFVKGQWMAESLGGERYERALVKTSERIPRGRVADPDDVAQAIVSLVGSDFITGHNLICDGGFLIRD